jgi:hypothetical protein
MPLEYPIGGGDLDKRVKLLAVRRLGFGKHDFWQMGNDQGAWDEESAAEIVPQ